VRLQKVAVCRAQMADEFRRASRHYYLVIAHLCKGNFETDRRIGRSNQSGEPDGSAVRFRTHSRKAILAAVLSTSPLRGRVEDIVGRVWPERLPSDFL
jgi:hypothetical protein